MYLMIRNKGVADYRAFTLLGVSTTRGTSDQGTVGQFGSGSKNAIALLLRLGIRPVIAAGTRKMEFVSKPQFIGGKQFNQVVVKYGGDSTATEDLGFTLEWGVQDWTKPAMAFREFVSNAIDGAILAGGTYADVEMELVEKPRGGKGHTAVFLPYTPEIEQCYLALGTQFLHFGAPDLLGRKMLPKRDPADQKVLIYKNGVLVSHIPNAKSVYDYNLGDELTLDESRNAHEWDVKYAVAKALRNQATAEELVPILAAVTTQQDCWEGTLDSSYIKANTYESADKQAERKDAFATAWKAVAGDRGVITTGSAALNSFVEQKGFRPVQVQAPSWASALESYGIASETNVLTKSEKDGKILVDATPEMVAAVDRVWTLLESFQLTNGKTKPGVVGFESVMDGGTQVRGYYVPGEDRVCLHRDLGGQLLFKVALEEVVHFCTNSVDGSRDLQDYLFRLVTLMAEVVL